MLGEIGDKWVEKITATRSERFANERVVSN